MIPRIVITGAPASGKTEVFERLRLDPRYAAFTFFEELARRLLIDNPHYHTDRAAFHREIYHRQTAREDALKGTPFISDRGTVDAFAFHPETAADVGTTIEAEYNRYNHVIHLGSSARLGPEAYKTDEIRRESLEDALVIEAAIEKVWRNHPGYHYLQATVDFEEKYTRFLSLVNSLVILTE